MDKRLTPNQWLKLTWWRYTNVRIWHMRLLTYSIKHLWFWKMYSALRKMSTTKIKIKDGIVWKHHRYFFWRTPENVGTYRNKTMILK